MNYDIRYMISKSKLASRILYLASIILVLTASALVFTRLTHCPIAQADSYFLQYIQ